MADVEAKSTVESRRKRLDTRSCVRTPAAELERSGHTVLRYSTRAFVEARVERMGGGEFRPSFPDAVARST